MVTHAERIGILARNLRLRREALGLSLSQVARLSGLSKAQVWDLEKARAKNPTLETLRGLSVATDTPIHILIGEGGEEGSLDGLFRKIRDLDVHDLALLKAMVSTIRLRSVARN
ncbi:transcriptional regulator [Candidatus Saccharibacteria bacterium]|nr:transcriptional regulator [Candidatus Saccharibacteria bacterium]